MWFRMMWKQFSNSGKQIYLLFLLIFFDMPIGLRYSSPFYGIFKQMLNLVRCFFRIFFFSCCFLFRFWKKEFRLKYFRFVCLFGMQIVQVKDPVKKLLSYFWNAYVKNVTINFNFIENVLSDRSNQRNLQKTIFVVIFICKQTKLFEHSTKSYCFFFFNLLEY